MATGPPRRVAPPQRLPGSRAPSSPSERSQRSAKEVWAGLFREGIDLTFGDKVQPLQPLFGPDGEPLEGLDHTFGQKPELATTAWYHADSGRQLEAAAQHTLQAICDTVEEMKENGRCLTGKFTNDPEILPDRKFPSVMPFPPDREQLMLPRERTIQEEPGSDEEEWEEPNVPGGPWRRLSEFQPLAAGTSVVFDSTPHYGRVYPGHLDNMYLVEALNAISLRPKLAKQLFLCYDQQRAVYILRLFKNGIWLKVEVDDYVPVVDGDPLCCRSEKFPHVLWPSLVEKAYAKVCTLRDPKPAENSGGWLAIGGGGHVEDALADLTGGVAGRFYTEDVSHDRLFLYLYTLQRDALFVCHVNDAKCARKGITLNACACHVINRAATHDGRCFVQVFSADVSGTHDGGLSESTPPELLRDYPERSWEGFFWLAIEDFHAYFDTVIECRLTNSPDVGIVGMPPRPGPAPAYLETIFANPGRILARRAPEVTVLTNGPCEVFVTAQQTDSRITQVGDRRAPYVPILMKVYESLGSGNVYSANMVCRSNWIPSRDAMVAFQTAGRGSFKVLVEMPAGAECDRLIIRCYSSSPAEFMVHPSLAKHLLALPQGPPNASRFSLVGTLDHSRVTRDDAPEPMGDDLDTIRSRHNGCILM
ncbi:unnamed protein product [Effrenium voratum]|uniref:Calpain catalytic domain-containing protein n=1 Tax=Effrenium voratum TaxID=2562239 RepID=A0AA36NAD7_9DINO|nr:unnamed protein product [Effrenium voratum]